MSVVTPQTYTGLLNVVSNPNATEHFVAISDMITVLALYNEAIYTSQECQDVVAARLGRALTADESSDLIAFLQYVQSGGADSLSRIEKCRLGFEALERNFGLTDAEIRQIIGI